MARVRLVTSTWGTGPLRALLIHGIASNRAGWWRLGPDLAALGYEVTAPDLRGHGTSPKGDHMRIDDYCDDVLALGGGWDLVLGHSLGGAVALAAMAAAPEWAARLILQEPAITGVNSPEVVAWLLQGYEEPISAERVAVSNPHWHPTDARHKAEALRQSGPEVVRRTIVDGEPWDYRDVIVALSKPTLLIGADPEVGGFISPEIGRAAQDANPMIRFEIVRDGSHSMHRDQYDAFWKLVGEFAS